MFLILGAFVFTVYILRDPRDNSVRYVGITGDVYERFKQHIHCDKSNRQKDSWLKELRTAQVMLIMESIDKAPTREVAYSLENFWIWHYQSCGETLYNIVNAQGNVSDLDVVTRRKKARKMGRSTRQFWQTIELLARVYEHGGVWPADANLTRSGKHYLRTHYSMFFTDTAEAAELRQELQEKAIQQKAKKPRKSRSKKVTV